MQQNFASPEALAHWHCTPEEWREFVGYETKQQEKIFKSLKRSMVIVIVIALLVMGLLLLIPLWLGYGWREDVWGPAVGVAFVAGLVLAVMGIIWVMQRSRLSSLGAPAGEVFLTLDGANLNGHWFHWVRSGLDTQRRLTSVKRQTVDSELGRSLEILEFRCVYKTVGRYGSTRHKDTFRVPVPAGREAEADKVIERLAAPEQFPAVGARGAGAPFVSAAQRAALNPLEHDFFGGTCRRCGSSVEAVSKFNWKCRQ